MIIDYYRGPNGCSDPYLNEKNEPKKNEDDPGLLMKVYSTVTGNKY